MKYSNIMWYSSTKFRNIKLFLILLLFFVNVIFIFGQDETNDLKSFFSLDTSFSMIAIKNLGWGLGINYEHKITDFLSVKSGFGHMTSFADILVTTVDLKFFLNYYPLNNGIDKLYIGLGTGCDFIMYGGDDIIPEDNALSLITIIGWKLKISPPLMLDPFIGWKYYIKKTDNYENVDRYLNSGFQWGIGLKIFFNKIGK